MRLRHVTLARNLPSIDKHGLLCSKSEGKKKVVWLHSASRSAWAAVHTVRRHGNRIENVVVLEVEVPRSWLRRSRKGLWYCKLDIPTQRFGQRTGFNEFSRSPVEDTEPRPLRIAC
jgi:hypothetical protein